MPLPDYAIMHPLTQWPNGREMYPTAMVGPMWGYPALLPAMDAEMNRGVTNNRNPWQEETGANYADWRAGAGISSPFGMRHNPITDRNQPHQGVDFAVPVGTPVFAPYHGKIVRVVFEEQNARSGNAVYLVDDEGWSFGFMHLSSALVRDGERVRKGQQIASSGRSGRVTGPHLHFEARDPNGRPVDPVTLYPPHTFARRG